MKKRTIKLAILSVEILGAIVAIAAAVAAYLFWRLDHSSIELGLLEGQATNAIENQLPAGHKADVDRILLSKDKKSGSYDVTFNALRITDDGGRQLLDLDSLRLNFTANELFGARMRPRRIILDGMNIDLLRRADRRFRLDYGLENGVTGERSNLTEILENSSYFREVFERAELTNANLIFVDESSDRRWMSENAAAHIVRTETGYNARIDASFVNEGRPSHLLLSADLNEETEILKASLDIKDAPLSDLLEIFYGSEAVIMTAPVSGSAEVTMTQDGEILSSSIDGRAQSGVLHLGGVSTAVRTIDLDAKFDPSGNKFTVSRLAMDTDRLSGELAGVVGLDFKGALRAPVVISYDISSDGLKIYENGVFPQAFDIDQLHIKGVYDVPSRKLEVSTLEAALMEISTAGWFQFERPHADEGKDPSPAISARIGVDGTLDPERLLRLWPKTLGLGARDFVSERIPRGTVSNLDFVVDLDAGGIDEAGGLPDEALTLTFDLGGATVFYAPGMTPVTGASGSAVLRGNSFTVDAPRGRVGNVILSNGYVNFTAFRPKGEASYFRFDAVGDASDILTILNQKPLEVLKSTALKPEAFSGKAKARIEIMRPNRRIMPRERYKFTGSATFDDLDLDEVIGGISLADAVGVLDLKTSGMTVTGSAMLGDDLINIDWRQNFYDAKDPTRLKISGVATSTTADLFGVPTRQLVRGPVAFDADVWGSLGSIRLLTLNTDFSDATIIAEAIGWLKPRGDPATGAMTIEFVEEGVKVRNIDVNGNGVEVKGGINFSPSGRIQSGQLSKIILQDAADVSLRATRSPSGALDLFVSGAYLNAGPIMETIFARDSADSDSSAIEIASIDWGDGFILKSRLDTLEVRNGVQYADTDIDFWRDMQRIQKLTVSARDSHGNPLSMGLKLTGDDDGPQQTVEARTDDIGSMMSGMFDLNSVVGGQGVVDLFVLNDETETPGEEKFSGLSGVIEARDIKIVGAPLLAKIFAAGSLDGLAGLLNNDGIEISQAFARFAFQDGALLVRDMRAAGPSVGLSMEGRVAAEADGGIDLNGAVAPIYQVNSFLGKTPILGDLLVNRDGEGVVALSYKVKGPASAPTVAVNPLSALAPGFLRRIFEPNRATLEEMMEKNKADEAPEGIASPPD